MAIDSAPHRRKATNLSIEVGLLDHAKELGINLSRAAEAGLVTAIRKEQARRWREENAEAIASSNAWVEKHGLPLAKHRLF